MQRCAAAELARHPASACLGGEAIVNRSLTAGLFALAALPGLVGCGAGFEAETQLVRPDNANGEVNGVLARALVLVKGKQASSAALAGTLINRSGRADVLSTVTLSDATAGATTVSVSPNLALAAGQLVPLGVGQFKPITIADARTLKVGNFTNVVLTFKEAGPLRLQLETVDRTLFFEDVTPEGNVPAGQAKQKIETKPPVKEAKPAVKPAAPAAE